MAKTKIDFDENNDVVLLKYDDEGNLIEKITFPRYEPEVKETYNK